MLLMMTTAVGMVMPMKKRATWTIVNMSKMKQSYKALPGSLPVMMKMPIVLTMTNRQILLIN
jgi:hypothetical protein